MRQNGFYVALHKTRKIEVDEGSHGLPPSLGLFPEYKVADYPGCPTDWSKDGFFVPVEEGQPLWIDFSGHNAMDSGNDECAVVCSVQRLNPVTGEPADLESGLSKEPSQNYLALPSQRWLDGYAKDGKVYQFVVTKAGEGLAVNEFVLPKHMQDSHALGFAFFAPKNPKPKVVREIRTQVMDFGPCHKTYGSLTKGVSEPMWFSPVHTPQNWQMADSTKLLRSASAPVSVNYCASLENSSGESLATGAVDSLDCCSIDSAEVVDRLAESQEMAQDFDKASMGAGGRIVQEIVNDNNTVDYYQDKPAAVITIYLALPDQFNAIMKKGRQQDASRKDRYIHSGEIGGVPVPLIKNS